MKIIVPTDFSSFATQTIQFAIEFTKQVRGDLILLHVLPDVGPTLGRQPTSDLKDEMVVWAEKEFSRIRASLKDNNISISHQIAYGPAVEKVLEPIIKAQSIDLVIIGSKGGSGVQRILLGSTTVAVVNQSSVPVIVVPKAAVIGPINHLLYVSDLKKCLEETKALVPFAQLMNTSIRLMHIPPVEYLGHIDIEQMVAELKKETGYGKISMELVEGKDVVKTVERYAEIDEGELLVLFTHHTSFLEQLFRKSIARELIWNCRHPVMVINNR